MKLSGERQRELNFRRSALILDAEIFGNSGDFVVVSNESFDFHGAAAFGTYQRIELELFCRFFQTKIALLAKTSGLTSSSVL